MAVNSVTFPSSLPGSSPAVPNPARDVRPSSQRTGIATGAGDANPPPPAQTPSSPALPSMPSGDQRASLRTWIGVLGAMMGSFMAVLNIQITNASLADIQGGIGAGIDDGGWISTSYLIGEIIVIPMTDYLSRVFSLRRFLITMAALFITLSAACAFAENLQQMIVLRALQGFAGGVLIPIALTVTLTKLPPSQHPIGISLFTITAIFAPSIGPTIGGFLTENYGWQTIFFINLVPGTLMLAALIYAIEPSPMRLSLLREGDWTGMAAMAVGLGTFQTVLEEGNKDDWFGSPMIVKLSVVAFISLTIFLIIELRRKNPVVELRLLRSRNFALGTLATTLFGVTLYGSVFLLPLFLSQIQGYNSEDIGDVMMWIGLPQLLIIPFTPMIMKKVDSRLIVMFGFFAFATSCFLNTRLSPNYSGDQFFVPNVVRAIGQSVIMAPLTVLSMAGLARASAGGASGLYNMCRNLGGAIGTAVLQTMLTTREHFHSAMINSKISMMSAGTRLRLDQLQHRFMSQGVSDPELAMHKAAVSVGRVIHHQALIMAYSDAFMLIGSCIATAGCIVLFLRKPAPNAGGGAPAH